MMPLEQRPPLKPTSNLTCIVADRRFDTVLNPRQESSLNKVFEKATSLGLLDVISRKRLQSEEIEASLHGGGLPKDDARPAIAKMARKMARQRTVRAGMARMGPEIEGVTRISRCPGPRERLQAPG